ncbi:putative membrane protein, partial [Frigoribacterium sp. 2355]
MLDAETPRTEDVTGRAGEPITRSLRAGGGGGGGGGAGGAGGGRGGGRSG